MNNPDGVGVDWRDVAAATTDGVGIIDGEAFVHADARLADTYGYDAEELVGTPWRSVVAPADRDRLERVALPRVRAEGDWRGEVRARHATGRELPQALSIRRAGRDAFVWAARARTEDAAPPPGSEPARDRFQRLFENAPVPIGIVTAPGELSYCNDTAVDFLGADEPADVVGRRPSSFVHPDDRDEIEHQLRQVLDAREATTPTERQVVGLDGVERTAVVSGAPMVYDGQPAARLILNDITEYKRTQTRLREERRFIRNVVDALDDVLYVVDEAGDFVFWNDELPDRFGYSDEAVASLAPRELVSPDALDALELDPVRIFALPDRSTLDLLTNAGEPIPHELHGVTYTNEKTGDSYRVGIARDISDRLARERELERQRDELATLDRINELLLRTVRELMQTASRDAVERTVCRRLTASDLYQFAWVGERELDGNRIVPRVTAGADDGYLDAVTITHDRSETGRGPAGRAMRTGDVHVVNVDDLAFEPWRDAASERGVESIAAVPLQHGEMVYGVLVLYATREDAFSPREQAGFDVLGRTVGSVIHSARSRELLFADTVVELEFGVERADGVTFDTAAALDCELTLAGYVASGDSWILYLAVERATPADVVAAASNDETVTRARVTRDTGPRSQVELVVEDAPLLELATAAGAAIRAATAGPRGGILHVEVPGDTDVRGFVERLTRGNPDLSLRARRERDREATPGGRPERILDDLTDRQRDALETAYHAGYYDWPRESTAETVAESLELAPATLHGHLRKAERTLLSALLDN